MEDHRAGCRSPAQCRPRREGAEFRVPHAGPVAIAFEIACVIAGDRAHAGTHDVHALIRGRVQTGLRAFFRGRP